MPKADSDALEDKLLKIGIYGPAGVRKTWWALRAAVYGFNVIDLDSDNGWKIKKQIPEEAQKRIGIVQLKAALTRPVMPKFLARFFKGEKFLWDEVRKVPVVMANNIVPEHSHVYVDANKLSKNDVVILDNWTTLCTALNWSFAMENNIDLSNPSLDSNWDGYRWSGALVNWYLEKIRALPCHVIVIGHETVYEKRDQEKGSPTKGEIQFTKTQMISTSGPQGAKMAKDFNEVFRFHMDGALFKIDARTDEEQDSKTQLVEPKLYPWKDLQFGTLCEAAGINQPEDTPPCEGFRFYDRGDEIDLAEVGLAPKVVASTPAAGGTIPAPATAKKTALTGLLKKG